MKKIVFAVSILAAFVMTACTPETLNEQLGIPEDAILLSSERFSGHGDKTSVDDLSVKWVNGDYVYLNGTGYSVTVAGDNAYVEDAPTSLRDNPVYGYYGVSGTPTWDSEYKKLTVTVPSEYTSSYDGDRQVIALPMVAYKSGAANKIEFKHVTAAVKVRIKNTTGAAVYLDKVVVKSAGKKLCGSTEVDLNDVDGLAATTTYTTAEKQVSVNFNFNTVTINNHNGNDANIVEVQVPILPLQASDLTVEVYTHKMVDHSSDNSGLLSVSYSYNFSKTNNVADNINRNVMLTANVNVQTKSVSPSTMDEVDHSIFSVSAGTAVRFSKGNLQCTKTGSAWSDGYSWSFLNIQYNTVETVYQSVGTDYAKTGTIGLFGWGTSGWNSGSSAYQPYATSMTDADYYSTGDIDGTNADWGVFNSITNGGTGWRLLTSSNTAKSGEWYYLFGNDGGTYRATTNSLSANARFIYAQIGGTYTGIIIFPDNYLHPVDADYAQNTATYNKCAAGNGMATVSLVGWSKMEAAGAVFLPITYSRGGSSVSSFVAGCYWTSTKSLSSGEALRVNFTQTSFNTKYSDHAYRGCAVRLVKEVPASAK